jgi:hypothetical protein
VSDVSLHEAIEKRDAIMLEKDSQRRTVGETQITPQIIPIHAFL